MLTAMTDQEITPFVFTLESDGRHAVYHGTLKNEMEGKMAQLFEERGNCRWSLFPPCPTLKRDLLECHGPDESVQAVIDGVTSEPAGVLHRYSHTKSAAPLDGYSPQQWQQG